MPDVHIHRIVDQMTYKKGSFNIADFIAYHYPTMYYLELKTTQGASLPKANISDNQLKGMYWASKVKGLKCYVICWFYEKDICLAFSIEYLWKLFNGLGKKSVRYDDPNGILIQGTKKTTYWQWDWKCLFERRKKNGSKQGTTTKSRTGKRTSK